MTKKMMLVFILAFVLNLIWEFSHSALYLNYQGKTMTDFILFRAAIVDALIIFLLVLAVQKMKSHTSLFVVFGGLIVAISIEIWALQTARWAYNPSMPIIPIIKTGLTPTIQLAITGYIAQKIAFLKQ